MVFVPLPELRSVRASSLTRALLSWVSSSVPLCRYPCSRPLPVRKRTFGQPVPTRRRVPFSWFLTTSTVCSDCSFAGLLHPATSSRFVAFPASLPANCLNSRGGSQDAFPDDASHTLQSFPLASSRTASPTFYCLPPRRNTEMFQPFRKPLGWFTNGRCPRDVPSHAPRGLSPSRCQDRFQP